MRKFIIYVLLSLVIALPTARTVQAETLKACELEIEYAIQSPAPDVPSNFTAFLGVWVGAWAKFPGQGILKVSDPTCAGLIVERVDRDGTAHTIHFQGRNPTHRFQGRVQRWQGTITDNRLYLPKGPNEIADAAFTQSLKNPKVLDALRRDGYWPGTFTKQ